MAKIPDLEEEEEAEIDLSLGLSIGGRFRKNPTTSIPPPDQSSSVRSPNVDRAGSNGGGEADPVDRQRRREIYTLRRREARKKKEERKSLCGSGVSVRSHDRMVMEARGLQCRARDRNVREAEARRSHRRKGGENGDPNPNPNQTPNPNQNPNPNPNCGGYQVSGFSVMPSGAMHFPFNSMQDPNGFHYPYLMPCWAPAPASSGGGGWLNSVRQSFRPFRLQSDDPNADPSRGGDGEQSGGDGGVLSRSTGSSLSAVSDKGSAGSMHGGSISSDSRSQSTRSPLPPTRLQVSLVCNGQLQLEHNASTNQKDSPVQAVLEEATEKVEANTAQSCPTKPEPTAGAAADQPSLNGTPGPGLSKPKPNESTMRSTPMISFPANRGGDDDENQKWSSPSLSLPHMPRVSTTGNGPNGKTITGFLYRYTKAEISIVCVCHGSSFSPEEFVKHAGGTDISHPLRHIVVVPFAFG